MDNQAYSASEALGIVAKDETKVARPAKGHVPTLCYGVTSRADVENPNSVNLQMLFVDRKQGEIRGVHQSEVYLHYIINPDGTPVEWVVLSESEVLGRSSLIQEGKG
jgi:hypothetical protein